MSTSSKPSEHPKGSWEDSITEDSSDLEDSWADDVMFDGSHSSGKEIIAETEMYSDRKKLMLTSSDPGTCQDPCIGQA